jgi:hypothetical protein
VATVHWKNRRDFLKTIMGGAAGLSFSHRAQAARSRLAKEILVSVKAEE